jgi:acetyl esterase
MALDEASAALVALASRTGRIHEMSVAGARQRSLAVASGHRPPVGRVRDALVPVAGGAIPVRVFTPAIPPRAVVVFCHGGGWVAGSVDESEPVCRALVSQIGCAVVSVGYRLAPEYRFPTAVEDSWAALRWAAAHVQDIAGEAVPVAVAGEGAGGNLAAVIARWSAERAGPALALQVLICPITDCDFEALTYVDEGNQLLLNREAMIWCWDQYVPDASARADPDASPLQTVFLSGLPPAIIVTAEYDPLRDEGELYALRLVQAGVRVEHRRFDGQMHGFFGQVGVLPGSAEGLQFVGDAITRELQRDQRGQLGVSSRVSSRVSEPAGTYRSG